MFRKLLKKTSIAFLFLLILFGCARFFDVSLGGIYDAARAPYLQVPTTDSIIIRWNTKKANIGVVRVGQSINKMDKIFYEKSADDEHKLELTGLSPNTKYYYRVGTGKYSLYEGKEYWFKTLPDKLKEPIRFWVTGDQGQAGVIQNNVRDAMLDWAKKNPIKLSNDIKSNLDFWLTTGDNAYRSGTNQQFQDNFFIPYGSILKHTPVWPIYGNHDARRRAFFKLFSFPEKAESGGVASHTPKYYSFNYASLHVVVLDTQSSRIQQNSRMLRWLEKDLAANKQKWLIAVFHHPPYTAGSHHSDNLADSFNRMQNVRRYMLPILENGGVDVVLSGHSHMYERSWFMNCHYGFSNQFSSKNVKDKQTKNDWVSTKVKQKGLIYNKAQSEEIKNTGTVYITLGSSARLDRGDLNHPAMPVSLHKSGSMIFDIKGDVLTANFITSAGIVDDSFSIVKDDKKSLVEMELCE